VRTSQSGGAGAAGPLPQGPRLRAQLSWARGRLTDTHAFGKKLMKRLEDEQGPHVMASGRVRIPQIVQSITDSERKQQRPSGAPPLPLPSPSSCPPPRLAALLRRPMCPPRAHPLARAVTITTCEMTPTRTVIGVTTDAAHHADDEPEAVVDSVLLEPAPGPQRGAEERGVLRLGDTGNLSRVRYTSRS